MRFHRIGSRTAFGESGREAVAEHRQAALGIGLRGLVLPDVPVLGDLGIAFASGSTTRRAGSGERSPVRARNAKPLTSASNVPTSESEGRLAAIDDRRDKAVLAEG